MQRSALYVMFLLALIFVVVNNAYAWTTWPSEDCNTWIEVNTQSYTVTSGGCYVLTTDVSTLSIGNDVAVDANISIDLNGHSLNILQQYGTPLSLEIFDGNLSNMYVSVSIPNVYLHDLQFEYIDVSQSRYVKMENVSGDSFTYVPVFLQSDDTTIDMNNVTFDGKVILDGVSYVNAYNTSFGSDGFIINVRNFVAVNSTYAGYPMYVVSDPSQITGDGAYIVASPTGTIQGQYYLALFAPLERSSLSIDFNGSTIRTLSAAFVSYLANATIQNMSDNTTVTGTLQNVTISGSYDVIMITSSANVINSSISAKLMDIFAGYTSDSVSTFAGQTLQFLSGGNYTAGAFRFDTLYLYPTMDTNNPTTFTIMANSISPYSSSNMYVHLYDSQDSSDISEVTFDVASIGDANTPVTLYLDGGFDGVTYVFNNTKIYGTIVCTGQTTPTLVFNNADLTNATIDSSCTDVQVEKPNLYITTNQNYQDVEEGQTVEFNVTVTSYNLPVDNVVVRAFAYNYYDQFDQNAEYVIPHIDANQSVTVTFEFNLLSSPATYRLYAIVDPDNVIDESDETDNSTRDTTGTYFYVNVVRYIDSCTTLYTGMYRLTTHITDANEDCFVVPNGEIVTLNAGTGVTTSDNWTTVVRNDGQLSINGMWGNGRIVNGATGVMLLYYVTPYTSSGFTVWNEGTLYVERSNEIPTLIHVSGTVRLDGPDSVIHEYMPLNSGSNMQVISSGNVFYKSTETSNISAPIYADTTIADSNGVYIFLNSQPTFGADINEALLIITGNGTDTNIYNKTIHGLKVLGAVGKETRVALDSVNIDNMLYIDSQGGALPVEAEIRNSTINAAYEVLFGASSVDISNTTINTPIFYAVSRSAGPAELNISSSSIYAQAMYFGGTVKLNFDLTSASVDFKADTYGMFSDTNIDISCVGDNWLYLGDYLLQNANIDASCLYNIDYNRNLWPEFLDTNISVEPGATYSVTVRVHNDADYTDVNTEVVLYVDGVEQKRTQVFVPHGSYADITFTAQAPLDVGAHELRVVVDPSDAVPESNESDNEATASIYVETHQAPSGEAPPSIAAAGTSGLIASNVIYVSANVGEEKNVVLHIYWEYGYETTATLTYVNINGYIEGPEKVTLRTGDNKIPVKVKVNEYGEIGKVVVYSVGKKQEITIYARPLAQLNIPTTSALTLLLIIAAAYLLAGYFGWI